MNAQARKTKKWSRNVTEHSHALDLEDGVFTWSDPKKIANSLKNSALNSKNRKSSPYRSAISMLTFYINRAGKNLDEKHKETLNKAKEELKILFKEEK